MMPLSECEKRCDDISTRLDTVPGVDRQTDGMTDLVKQYRALYALHAYAR